MISQSRVQEIAGEVAKANLGQSSVETITSEPASDSAGRDALRITIVIKPGVAAKFDGDQLLDTLVQIQQGLRGEGEDRLAIVEYATKRELQESGDA